MSNFGILFYVQFYTLVLLTLYFMVYTFSPIIEYSAKTWFWTTLKCSTVWLFHTLFKSVSIVGIIGCFHKYCFNKHPWTYTYLYSSLYIWDRIQKVELLNQRLIKILKMSWGKQTGLYDTNRVVGWTAGGPTTYSADKAIF